MFRFFAVLPRLGRDGDVKAVQLSGSGRFTVALRSANISPMRALIGFIVLLPMGLAFLLLSKNAAFLQSAARLAPSNRIAAIATRTAALITILVALTCLTVFLATIAGVIK